MDTPQDRRPPESSSSPRRVARGLRKLLLTLGTVLTAALPGLRCRPEPAPPAVPGSEQAQWPAMLRDWVHRSKERFDAPTLPPSEVHLDQFLVVDVRDPRESAVSILPGARRLDDAAAREAFLQAASELPPDAPVLVYCTVGWRSGEYARALTDAGVEAFNLEGGLCAWALADGTIVDRVGSTTRRIHAYSAEFAGCVPESHEAVTD